jgi:hypothetical protein
LGAAVMVLVSLLGPPPSAQQLALVQRLRHPQANER